MLINLYKTPKPAILVSLPLVAAVLWLPVFIQPLAAEMESKMPLYRLFFTLLIADNMIASRVFAIALLLAEAILINNLVIKNRLFGKSNYLPSLFYVVIASSAPSLLGLHPALFANLFLIFSTEKLLNIYRKEKAFDNVFDGCLHIGIASLFYLPAIAFYPFVFVCLVIMKPFVWREWVISLTGLMLPYFFTATWYFCNEQFDFFWHDCILGSINNPHDEIILAMPLYLLAGISSALLLLALNRLVKGLVFNTVRIKKILIMFIWFFVFSIISVLLAPSFSVQYFSMSLIPLSIYFANYFMQIRRGWLGEAAFTLLIGAIIYVQIMRLF